MRLFGHALYETRTIESEKNGIINVHQDFQSVSVSVGRTLQTGTYLRKMWSNAFKRIKVHVRRPIKNILMFGLGAGGEIKTLYKNFPGAHITVVEFDTAMISLSDELALYKPFSRPRIVHASAKEYLDSAKGMFDLVVVDMFMGRSPDTSLLDASYAEKLRALVHKHGLIIVNAYHDTSYLSQLKNYFSPIDEWCYELNYVALYSQFLLDEHFTNRHEWPELVNNIRLTPFLNTEVIRANPIGIRQYLGFLIFEHYTGDREPEVTQQVRSYPHITIMHWQPVRRAPVPHGWSTFFLDDADVNGFVQLSQNYHKDWSETARRDLKKWEMKKSDYTIETVSWEEFKKFYIESPTFKNVGSLFLPGFTHLVTTCPENVSIWGVRDNKSGRLIAGLGTFNSRSARSSYYYIGFHAETTSSEAMTALMNHWFSSMLAQDYVYLHFGGFWSKGKPKSFKGYSTFKGKFGPLYVLSPKPLYKIVFRWFKRK